MTDSGEMMAPFGSCSTGVLHQMLCVEFFLTFRVNAEVNIRRVQCVDSPRAGACTTYGGGGGTGCGCGY